MGHNSIGRWMDKTAFPGVITFFRKDGKVFKTKTFLDGSKGEYEMVLRKVGSQTRYSEKDSTGDADDSQSSALRQQQERSPPLP